MQVPNENLSTDQVTDVYGPRIKTASWRQDLSPGRSCPSTITVKDEAELIHDLWMPRPQQGPISGRVVLAGNPSRGVAGAKVWGICRAASELAT